MLSQQGYHNETTLMTSVHQSRIQCYIPFAFFLSTESVCCKHKALGVSPVHFAQSAVSIPLTRETHCHNAHETYHTAVVSPILASSFSCAAVSLLDLMPYLPDLTTRSLPPGDC